MGKGWIWLATSGMTSKLVTKDPELAKSMDGFLGTGPASGEGSVYLNFLSKWLEKDPSKYPGIVHKLVVWTLYQNFSFQYIFSSANCIFT